MRALLFASLVALVFAASPGCATRLPNRGSADADIADAMVAGADASFALTPSAVQIRPRRAYLQAEQSQQFEAQLMDQWGQPMISTAFVTWTGSDTSVAQVSASGLLVASQPGVVELQAQIGTISATVSVEVFGELEACCSLSLSLSLENFCSLDPNTASCPMTRAGGACDLDGDGDYDEMSDADMQAMTSFFSSACSGAQACVIDEVANVATDCSSEFDPDNRQWRCVELTTDFPGTQASQVCQDLGAGPRWYTYNLTPLDCCACDQANLPSDQIPASCGCVGSGCL